MNAFPQDQYSKFIAKSTQAAMYQKHSAVSFTARELIFAKTIYWVLIPMMQYILAMVLADMFQYFTHRAFHVNK